MENTEVSVLIVDAFTRTPDTGNRAGVVLDARELTREQMAQIAIGVGASETIFILPTSLYEVTGLYFTANGTQVPICGHATIAGFHAYATEKLDLTNPETVTLHTDSQWTVGTLSVDIEEKEGKVKPTLTQGAVKFEEIIEGEDRAKLIAALGLTEADLVSDLPIQIVGTGHPKVMIPTKSRRKLNDLKPNMDALSILSEKLGPSGRGYFVFTFDHKDDRYPPAEGEPEILIYGRMFAPAIGIQEDPVTGNANGPVGAYLVRYGNLVPDAQGRAHFYGKQGEAIGKAGVIEVNVTCEGQEPKKVQISGDAVRAGTMVFELTSEDSVQLVRSN